SGIGIFASGMMLAAAHFPQHAKPGQVPAEVVRHLGLIYVPTLAALYVLAIVAVSGYRITRESHAESLRQLAAAADLASEGEPASSEGHLG
ncbi:hypothetical protein, partial [Phenylobacterium aquaticum]|uniref:hypothetical protein n=1 Tax=Phenylobacterium aquaticum TaxID=1763816 RepID=UPI0026F08541